MTHEQRTNSERADDVRAHEQAQYATPPTVPTYPTVNRSSSEGLSGIATRENDQTDEPDPFLALYSINANRLVRIGSYNNRINDVMRQFRWATLERNDGWYFPEPYLSRVELALMGVDVRLANRDGSPTPAAEAAERRDAHEHTKRLLAELHEARDLSQAEPIAIRDAREDCKRAFADAIAAKHPEPEPADETDDAAS